MYKETKERTRRKFTGKQLQLIEKLSGRISFENIAALFDTDKDYFKELMRHDVALRNAIDRGRANGVKKVSDVLYNMALKKDFRAIALYLSMFGKSEVSQELVSQGPSKPGIAAPTIDVTPVEIGTRVEKVMRCVGDELTRTAS